MKLIFLIQLIVTSCIISCNSSGNNTSKINHLIEPVIPDSIIDLDTTPVYLKFLDRELSDGFIYPVKNDRANNFYYTIQKNISELNSISENIIYKGNFKKPIEIRIPGEGYIRSSQEDSGKYKLSFASKFLENGTIKIVEISLDGIDSLPFYDMSEFEHLGFMQKSTVIGYLLPNKKTDNRLVVKVSYWDSIVFRPVFLESPSQFFKETANCIKPKNLEKFILVHKSDYKMYYFEKGELKSEYVIGLSQSPVGHKEKQGDNKLPEGQYRITEKKRGPFYGDVGEFLGVAWMEFNYPNKYDAVNGYNSGAITLSQKNMLVQQDKNNQIASSSTPLGGDIGVHGWKGDWIANGTQNLTWGCVTMFNRDIDVLYDKIPLQTTIIIVP